MNRITSIFTLVLITSFASFAQNMSPIAHYKFNGDVNDDSPNGNHGRIIGFLEPVEDRFGNKNGAFYFSGNGNSFIEIPSSPTLESPETQITILGWFKLKSHSYSNYWLTMICKGNEPEETSLNPQYRFQVSQNYKSQLSTCSPDIAQGNSVVSLNSEAIFCDTEFMSHKFEPDTWHFYAITFNGNEVTTFYDGIKTVQFFFNSELIPNSSPLYIGRDNPGITDDFRGALDDIRIYNRSLSELEIYNIYAETSLESFENKTRTRIDNIGKQFKTTE
ncbi:LamG domain-containing protein [Aquirufa antheringensis]